MTKLQVFKWFCKEQKIMPLIRELYYKIRPIESGWRQPTKYLSFDEYINNIIDGYGFLDVFTRIENSYYYKIGWEKYSDFSKERGIANINNKWRYFVMHNIQLVEGILKVGDEVDYKRGWYDFGNDDENLLSGEVVSIHLDTNTVTVKGNNYNWSISIANIRRKGEKEILNLDYYIKRNRKKYYGVNRK